MTDINPLDNRLEQYDCEQCRQDAGAMRSYMILCPTCGNKRCPKAQNHIYKCTGSNAVGQVGEIVGYRIDTPEPVTWNIQFGFGLKSGPTVGAMINMVPETLPVVGIRPINEAFEKWLCENRGYTKD